MDSKASDRERLLKLIDGQPAEPSPASGELPDKTIAVLSKLRSTLGKMGFDKREMAVLAVIIAVVLFFLVSKFMTGVKEPEEPAALSPAARSETVLPSRLPAEPTAGAEPGLRLVGVDWGDTPVALLEDVKTGKTYFVKAKDRILGTQVKSVEKDRVILLFRGQHVELR